MFWKRVILSWMTLLTLVFASASATAATDVSARTHVGGIDLAAAIGIEASGLASAEEHLGKRSLATAVTPDVPHAARGLPTIAKATNREMLGQAVQAVKALPGTAAQKADAFQQLAGQITRLSSGSWTAASR